MIGRDLRIPANAFDLGALREMALAIRAVRRIKVVNGTMTWSDSGCTLTVAPQSTAGGSFLGEYSASTQYAAQNWVVISSGAGIGSYVCVLAPPVGTSPTTGAPYWVSLPSPTPGIWL